MDRDLKETLDRIAEHLSSIDITLAKREVMFDDFTRRIRLLEVQVEPLEQHVAMVSGAAKFLGLIGTLVGLFVAMKGWSK